MLLRRYVYKDILLTFVAISCVLLGVTISNKLMLLLSKAVRGELAPVLALKLISLYLPELLVYVLPLACYFAVLLTYSKMYSNGEMISLQTLGLPPNKLLQLTLFCSLVVALLVALLSVNIVPNTRALREGALVEGKSSVASLLFTPGKFVNLSNGKMFFFVKDAKGVDFTGVFVAEKTANGWTLIKAESAQLIDDNDSKYLILEKGKRYFGSPLANDYQVMEFAKCGRQISSPSRQVLNIKTTSQLLQSESSLDIAELHWRFILPFSTIILSLLALPLSKVKTRAAKVFTYLPAVILYVVYFGSAMLLKRYVALGIASPWSLWALQLVFLVLAGALFRKDINNKQGVA